MSINEMLAGTIPEDVLDQILGQHPSQRMTDGIVPTLPYLQRESNYGANDIPTSSSYGASPASRYGNSSSIYDTNPNKLRMESTSHAKAGGCC